MSREISTCECGHDLAANHDTITALRARITALEAVVGAARELRAAQLHLANTSILGNRWRDAVERYTAARMAFDAALARLDAGGDS